MRPTATVATSSRLPVPSLGSGTARNCRNLTHLRGVSRVFDQGRSVTRALFILLNADEFQVILWPFVTKRREDGPASH
jgi:hypothetical protein